MDNALRADVNRFNDHVRADRIPPVGLSQHIASSLGRYTALPMPSDDGRDIRIVWRNSRDGIYIVGNGPTAEAWRDAAIDAIRNAAPIAKGA